MGQHGTFSTALVILLVLIAEDKIGLITTFIIFLGHKINKGQHNSLKFTLYRRASKTCSSVIIDSSTCCCSSGLKSITFKSCQIFLTSFIDSGR